jgi:glycosyltransferase involved in cell wall biosynthesis
VVTRHVTFAVPGDLSTPTGGYAYDRRVIAELRTLGWQVDVCNLGNGFPRPGAAQITQAYAMLAQTTVNAALIIDGLAYGVMDAFAAALAKTHRIIALIHHPLALETGLTTSEAEAFRRSEQAVLAHARRTVVTSQQTAEILVSSYGVARDTIVVAVPGHDVMPSVTRHGDDVVRLLSVGAIVPRKGYDVLITALAQLRGLPWHLTIIGDDTRSPETTLALCNLIEANRLRDSITVRGAVSDEELADTYRQAHVYVTASHFEGYGMAAATAVACGLPIVATAGGALTQTVGNAGLLVPPNNPAALSDALRRMIVDRDLWMQVHRAACAAAKSLPRWRDTAEHFLRAIEAAP